MLFKYNISYIRLISPIGGLISADFDLYNEENNLKSKRFKRQSSYQFKFTLNYNLLNKMIIEWNKYEWRFLVIV